MRVSANFLNAPRNMKSKASHRPVSSFFQQQTTGTQKQVINRDRDDALRAELRFAVLLAKKDLSFNLSDALSELIPQAFPDSKAGNHKDLKERNHHICWLKH